MTRSTATWLAALSITILTLPLLSDSAEARRRHRGAGIAAGVALGVAAAAIIANSNRAHASGRNSRFWARCDRWYRQCSNGNDYSCEKYETRGCTE